MAAVGQLPVGWQRLPEIWRPGTLGIRNPPHFYSPSAAATELSSTGHGGNLDFRPSRGATQTNLEYMDPGSDRLFCRRIAGTLSIEKTRLRFQRLPILSSVICGDSFSRNRPPCRGQPRWDAAGCARHWWACHIQIRRPLVNSLRLPPHLWWRACEGITSERRSSANRLRMDGRGWADCQPVVVGVLCFLGVQIWRWHVGLDRNTILDRVAHHDLPVDAVFERAEQVRRCPALDADATSRPMPVMDGIVGPANRGNRGVVPRDWDAGLVSQMLMTDPSASEYPYVQLLAFYRCMHENRPQVALEHLENVLARSARSTKVIRQITFLEAACCSALVRKNVTQARTWLQRAGKVRKPLSTNVAEATIAICEKRYDDALRFVAAARTRIERRKLDSGLARFAREKLAEYDRMCEDLASDLVSTS